MAAMPIEDIVRDNSRFYNYKMNLYTHEHRCSQLLTEFFNSNFVLNKMLKTLCLNILLYLEWNEKNCFVKLIQIHKTY